MNNSIKIEKNSNCCGCRACENTCPKRAITMIENEEGFLYPNVDEEKCVNCGLCKKICPWINEINRESQLTKPVCYAAKSKDIIYQKSASSGGVFPILADYILENNGIVIGCTIDENLKVRHIAIKNKEELTKIMGSKYVSSDLDGIFKIVKEELNKGTQVLFSGVPCQISALKNFLRKDYENLITVEVICHGTPSQKLFDKYIEELENKYKGKIIEYDFRSKKAAYWGTYKALVKIKNNDKTIEKKINADFDKYYWSFLNSKNCRESCYECKFAKKERNSDFTLGDFWGIEKIMPEMIDYNGVSIVIINSDKGLNLFSEVKEKLNIKSVDYDTICKHNGQLEHPPVRPLERDTWYNKIDEDNFIKYIKIKNDFRDYIKIIFPQKLKFKIKKILKKKK